MSPLSSVLRRSAPSDAEASQVASARTDSSAESPSAGSPSAEAPPRGGLVEIRGVHKSFGELEVLRGIDLTIAPGEVTAVLGPSG